MTMQVSSGSCLRSRVEAFSRMTLRMSPGLRRVSLKSGIRRRSRPLGVTTSGALPSSVAASDPVSSLTAVKQSASLAEVDSMECLAVILSLSASWRGLKELSMSALKSDLPLPHMDLPSMVAWVVKTVPMVGQKRFRCSMPAPHIHSWKWATAGMPTGSTKCW